jgi:hypothetical protein
VEEALRGGADFFVLALLDYQGAPAGASKIKPQTVSLRLFKTRPQTFLYEQLYAPRGQESGENELANARRVVRLLLPHLNVLDE